MRLQKLAEWDKLPKPILSVDSVVTLNDKQEP